MLRTKVKFAPFITVFICMLALFICLPAAYAHEQAGLQVKGKAVETDPAPFMESNRIMVPVRELAGVLGAEVSWNGENQEIKVVQGERQIIMFIGKLEATVNGKSVQMDNAPLIVDGKAVVPLRILAEGLQVSVTWNPETRIVNLEKLALIAGSSLDYPPFEFKEGDKIVGFEIDLIQAMEELLGEEIIVQDISFDKLIPSLREGQIDMIVSGLTIFEQRKEIIDFTVPYFDWGQIILVRKGGNQDMVLEDLAGKKIAIQAGSYADEFVSDLQKSHPGTQLQAYESLEEVWAAVEKGQADAAIVPHATTAYYLINHKESNLQMVGKVFASQPSGIALQKGNQELLDKLNKSLETIKKNGTYDQIYEKWFGPQPAF